MDDDDKGFFILVLGVLAAILMVVSWWAIRDDDPLPFAAPELQEEAPDEAAAEAETEAAEPEPEADEPEPTAVPEPEPTAVPEPEPVPDAAPPAPPTTVADIVAGDSNLTTVAGLIGAAGLGDALSGEGPFTILAPSNAAVEGFDPDAAGRLFGGDRAADVLSYHVLPGTYTAEDLRDLLRGTRSAEVETLQGDPITISVDGDDLFINGNALVSAADASADNGVVHTIENILIPREAGLNLIVGLEPIQFASGSATISAESTSTLDQVVEALAATNNQVVVEGHTDSQGDPASNQALSLERARSVVNYLVANGIEETRLSAEGFGADQPVASNDTAEGRAENRRIEFRVLGAPEGATGTTDGTGATPSDETSASFGADESQGEVIQLAESVHEVYTDIVIEATPEQVWTVLSDFQTMPLWSTTFQGLTGDVSDGGAVEARFIFGDDELTFPHELRFVDGQMFGWSDPLPNAPGISDDHSYMIAGSDGVNTRFAQIDRFSGTDPELTTAAVAETVLAAYQQFNLELKAEVEARFPR